MSRSQFWKKVEACNHEWSDSYYASVSCGTPYCDGEDLHCVKCGVYKTTCGCGCYNELSGWPYGRRMAYERKKYGCRR